MHALSLGNAKMPNFMFDGKILENVQTYKYLGIMMHKNGKFTNAIQDRIFKTNRAIHMIKQVLGYSSNVSVKLAMSLFDKLISPILLYGSSIWSIPDCNRHIHIKVNQIEPQVKKQVQALLFDRLNKHVIIDEVRAYRDKNIIVVKLHNICDKLELIHNKNNSIGCNITNHVTKDETKFEVPHSKFCKYAIGANKSASVTGVLSELDRYPIAIKARVQSISYWHRLNTGENGELLKNAFYECANKNHPFYQNVQYLLNKNGFGNISMSPHIFSSKQVSSLAKQSMPDQHKQHIHDCIQNDDKFSTLLLCTQDRAKGMEPNLYYHKIRSPFVRKCFVRLRLDKSYKYIMEENDNICDQCGVSMTSRHLLTECNKTYLERMAFIDKIKPIFSHFEVMGLNYQTKVILNLAHKNEKVKNYMCAYVKTKCVRNNII